METKTATVWFWRYGILSFDTIEFDHPEELWVSWYYMVENDDCFTDCVEIDGEVVSLESDPEYEQWKREKREAEQILLDQRAAERRSKSYVHAKIRHPLRLDKATETSVETHEFQKLVDRFGEDRVRKVK